MPTFSNSPIPTERPEAPVVPEAHAPTAAPAAPISEDGTASPAAPAASAPTASPAPAEEPAPAPGTVPPPSAPPRPAIRASRDDNVVLRNFGKAQPASLERLNADFGLKLNEGSFARLRSLFLNTIRRDPTAGELRLLDTLERVDRMDPSREAVGELYTDSPLIAETWADMMAKHAALYSVRGSARSDTSRPAPPCTFDDALSLAGRYLYRTGACLPVTDGGKNAQGRIAVLSAPWQEAEALAAGYTPFFRAAVGTDSRSVWIRRGAAPAVTPEKAGDFLLCLRRATPETVAALIDGERQKTRPALGEIRAVAKKSVLDAVLSVCSSAELYPHRLLRMDRNTLGGRVEVDALCARPVLPPDGTSDYILRVPLKRMKEMTETLRALSADGVVIGQVRSGDKTLIRMRNRLGTNDVTAAELPSSLLRSYSRTGLHRLRAEVSPDTASEDLGVYSPAVARYPSPHAAESGLTPEGWEAVALTRTEGQVLPVPEASLLLSSFAVTVTDAGVGYHAAMEALSYAVGSLANRGVSLADIRLAVSVTSRDGVYAPGDITVEVLCGLYRFAASNSIPAEDPVMTVIPKAEGETPSVSLTVTAWARHRELCEKLTAETQAPRYAVGTPVSKEAPAFILPILHRSCEPSLRALAALLKACGEAAVAIQPVAIKTVEVEVEPPVRELAAVEKMPTEASESSPVPAVTAPAMTDAPVETSETAAPTEAVPAEKIPEAPRTRKESRRILDPDSVARLAERLGQWTTPVFAMNTEDARMILSEPTVLATLERRLELGYPVIALCEACPVFAEMGLLPSALKNITTVPASGREIAAVCVPTGKTVTRMPRADLLSPAEEPDTPTLVTLTLPNGEIIPDGFTGRDGKVLGLLNGLDTAAAPLLFTHTFENKL